MKIAIEGADALYPTERSVVLLDLNEAADLYKELHKIFGNSPPAVRPVEIPPLSPAPTPKDERQKSLEDFIKEMEARQKRQQPFEYNPPVWGPAPGSDPSGTWKLGEYWYGQHPQNSDGTYDSKFTAAAAVDYNAIAKNNQTFTIPAHRSQGPQ